MTGLGPLFKNQRPAYDGVLPPATLAALGEIPCEGQRKWIESVIIGFVSRGRDVESIREVLSHERLSADLVARLVMPLREGEKA